MRPKWFVAIVGLLLLVGGAVIGFERRRPYGCGVVYYQTADYVNIYDIWFDCEPEAVGLVVLAWALTIVGALLVIGALLVRWKKQPPPSQTWPARPNWQNPPPPQGWR